MIRLFTVILALCLPAHAQDFAPIYSVLSHPRCANCHVADDIPLWSTEGGGTVPHGMAIRAGESRMGIETLPCDTCHRTQNGALPHSAPGAETWLLPPPEMAWAGRSARAVCEQFKDPSRNGGRTLADIADHIGHDPLVLWGWDPGSGRMPVPGTPEDLIQAILAWEAAEATCP